MARRGGWRTATIACLGAACLALGAACAPRPAFGDARVVGVEDLDPRGPWRIERLDLEGVGFVRSWLLRSGFATRPRPWWAFWRPREEFVPAYFAEDVERVARELEADGYYDARVAGEVEILREPPATGPPAAAGDDAKGRAPDARDAEPGLVEARIRVELGEATDLCSLLVDLGSEQVPPADGAELLRRLPLRVGERFRQADYQGSAARLGEYFSENGHPAPEVQRAARVDVARRCAGVSYRVSPGPQGVFGATQIDGLGALREALVTRELAYRPGERFDSRRLRETERRLRGLRVFSLVRLEHGSVDGEGRVPIQVRLEPGPSREVRLGVGYSTEDGVRGLVSWWNYNLFGGAEQLGLTTRLSQVTRFVSATYVQPHFPGLRNRSLLTFNLGQDDESTYLLDYSRVVPQVDWRATPDVAGSLFLRSEYDSLSGVSDPTRAALREYQSSGFTVSLGSSVRWTRVDDVLDPRRGVVLGLSAELAGGPLLDADVSFFRLIGSARAYTPLVGDLTLATRLTLGAIPPYDGQVEIPLWDRFYAGGSGIYPVRGYGRRRIGPITGSNDPLGGRSMAIGSLELRHPVWGPLLGVAFVDAGDIELSAWTLDPRNVQTGVGFGLRANSPVGPLEIDLGFGLDRPRGDSLVQVAFSIGPEF